ncbi:hypothetical protein STEG23_007224 [Scotinomys teguina]
MQDSSNRRVFPQELQRQTQHILSSQLILTAEQKLEPQILSYHEEHNDLASFSYLLTRIYNLTNNALNVFPLSSLPAFVHLTLGTAIL